MKQYALIVLISCLSATSPSISTNLHTPINFDSLRLDTKNLALYKTKTHNNPFNIRNYKSNTWLGEVETASRFEVFQDKEFGIRAGLKLLQNYDKKHKLTTVEKIIHKYAPAKENDTKQYIANVYKITGFEKNQKLDLQDKETLISLAYAITICEGNKVSKDELSTVYTKYLLNV